MSWGEAQERCARETLAFMSRPQPHPPASWKEWTEVVDGQEWLYFELSPVYILACSDGKLDLGGGCDRHFVIGSEPHQQRPRDWRFDQNLNGGVIVGIPPGSGHVRQLHLFRDTAPGLWNLIRGAAGCRIPLKISGCVCESDLSHVPEWVREGVEFRSFQNSDNRCPTVDLWEVSAAEEARLSVSRLRDLLSFRVPFTNLRIGVSGFAWSFREGVPSNQKRRQAQPVQRMAQPITPRA